MSMRLTGWLALAELMRRPWFRRAWVVQEVGMARVPVVLYGEEEFSYRDLVASVTWARSQLALTKYGIVSLLIHTKWRDWTRWEQGGEANESTAKQIRTYLSSIRTLRRQYTPIT
jgi:hypothetical protein